MRRNHGREGRVTPNGFASVNVKVFHQSVSRASPAGSSSAVTTTSSPLGCPAVTGSAWVRTLVRSWQSPSLNVAARSNFHSSEPMARIPKNTCRPDARSFAVHHALSRPARRSIGSRLESAVSVPLTDLNATLGSQSWCSSRISARNCADFPSRTWSRSAIVRALPRTGSDVATAITDQRVAIGPVTCRSHGFGTLHLPVSSFSASPHQSHRSLPSGRHRAATYTVEGRGSLTTSISDMFVLTLVRLFVSPRGSSMLITCPSAAVSRTMRR